MHQEHCALRKLVISCLMLVASACSAQSPLATRSASAPVLAPTSDVSSTDLPTRQSTVIPSPTNTYTASFPFDCKSNNDLKYHSSLSPDGDWLAISCSFGMMRNLEIVNHTGTRWMLRYQDFVTKEYDFGSLNPLHWLDSGYLYFTPNPNISSGGACLYHGSRSLGLYRIDLHTGFVSAILPPLNTPDYQIAFSPSGRRLAYIGTSNHVAFLDLEMGKEEAIDVQDAFVGNLTWSPDGSKLAYATCQPNQDDSGVVESSVRVYTLDMHASKTILVEEGKLLGIDVADANPLLKIAEDQSLNNPDDLWFYDWSSGRFVAPQQTPTPSP